MAEKLIKIERSAFTISPKAEEILGVIMKYEGNISKQELYDKVKQVDPNLPGFEMFSRFLKALNAQRQNRVGYLMNDLKNELMKKDENGKVDFKSFLDLVYENIFTLGSVAIKSEVEEAKRIISEGKELPVAMRKRFLQYFFQGTKSYNEGRSIDVKVQADDRTATILENLISAAQYGKLKKDHIIEGEFTEPKKVEEAKT